MPIMEEENDLAILNQNEFLENQTNGVQSK
jgi:hypothetical protein